jgi:hypothetical protein
MTKPVNPYLDLMEDDEPKKSTAHPTNAPVAKPQDQILTPEILQALDMHNIRSPMSTVASGAPFNESQLAESGQIPAASSSNAPKNPYEDLMDDDEFNLNKPYSLSGTPLSLASGIGGRGVAASVAEMLTGAPAGSVAEIGEIINPTKKKVSPQVAARLAMEAKNPSMTSGAKWKANWANIDDPTFQGGVPEAAQSYNRGKPSGKVTGPLYKKFGNQPLSIQGQSAANTLSEAEALAKQAKLEKEIQAGANAYRLTGPLSYAGRALGAAGLGLGAADIYNRIEEKKPVQAALSAVGTAASTAAPFLGTAASIPLAGAGALLPAALYMQDNPEAKEKFLKGMSGKGAFANRGFGLD